MADRCALHLVGDTHGCKACYNALEVERDSYMEAIPEFRELLDACEHLLARKYDFQVTSGDWKQFARDVEKAIKFMEQVDGPKKECTCAQHLDGVKGACRQDCACDCHKT